MPVAKGNEMKIPSFCIIAFAFIACFLSFSCVPDFNVMYFVSKPFHAQVHLRRVCEANKFLVSMHGDVVVI